MDDLVEFYNGRHLVVAVKTSIVPLKKSLVSIRKKTWVVVGVTYAVDYADDTIGIRGMRANVDLKEIEWPNH